MKQPSCANCKHWAQWYKPDKNGFADCDKIEQYHADYRGKKDKDLAGMSVDADDDQGLSAKFFTHPTFFCAHFEPKKRR